MLLTLGEAAVCSLWCCQLCLKQLGSTVCVQWRQVASELCWKMLRRQELMQTGIVRSMHMDLWC